MPYQKAQNLPPPELRPPVLVPCLLLMCRTLRGQKVQILRTPLLHEL